MSGGPEPTDVSESGYPEEQPGGDAGQAEDKPPRESAKAGRKQDDPADDTDYGKATGNRRSAG